MKLNILSWVAGVVILVVLQGCAPAKYIIHQPSPSATAYSEGKTAQKETISISDNRGPGRGPFSFGVLPANLELEGKPLEEFSFLRSATLTELNARGVALEESAAATTSVSVEKFLMRNHRTNAYTPFITFTLLKAKVSTPEGDKPIAVYIKRGKVPVWGFDEIIEPVFNDPLDLAVKEFAAKINREVYQCRLSDEQVKKLVERINSQAKDKNRFKKVYQLGFSNNKSAIPALRKLVDNADEYVRMAAISSLGILQDHESLNLLKKLALTADSWADRAMALKAIGDLGSMPALDFLAERKEKIAGSQKKEDLWSREVIELYL